MIERGPRDPRPFGQRRSEDGPGTRGPGGGTDRETFEIPGWDGAPKSAGPLAWAVRTAVVAGLVAVFATQYLARVSTPGDGAVMRMAQGAGSPIDPETTGSIGHGGTTTPARPAPLTPAGAAQATRLDPCALAGSVRPRT